MLITVTSLRLRSLFDYFALSLNGFKISRQARGQEGFIRMKNTGFGYLHYTISAWEKSTDLRTFSRSGAHLEAMKGGRKLATEVRVYTYESDRFPDWKEAKALLEAHGRVIPYK